MHEDAEDQAECIHQQIPLAFRQLLPAVIAIMWAAEFGGLG